MRSILALPILRSILACATFAMTAQWSLLIAGDPTRVVMLKDQTGYELHMSKETAQSLLSTVENEFTVEAVQTLLENTSEAATTASGFGAVSSTVVASTIGYLFEKNATKFKTELKSKIGSNGIILTIKPQKPLAFTGPGGVRFDPYDIEGANRHNIKKLFNSTLRALGGGKYADNNEKIDEKIRGLFWVRETPITVLINPSEWSIATKN